MKYNCLIVEDNEIERDLLENYLLKLSFFNIVAVCSNAVEALKVLISTEIDIVFSDVDMPDISGLELLKSISNPPAFIFVTTYPEYALDSINLDAIDFLVKPIKLERLIKACHKAVEYLDFKQLKLHKEEELEKNDFFFIKGNKGYIRIDTDNILFIESFGDFSRLHTLDQQQHISLVNLKNIANQLPQNMFIRVHRQYLINQNHILEIVGNDIVLQNQHRIMMGATYRENLIKLVETKTLTRFGKS